MIEAALLMGGQQGPLSAWQFVGQNAVVSNGLSVEVAFPAGIQPGDLVVAVMSNRNDGGAMVTNLPMNVDGWFTWGDRTATTKFDVVCAACYRDDLLPPKWQQDASRYLHINVLVYRAPGWSSVKLESQKAPYALVDVATNVNNTLILSIGVTPGTTSRWVSTLSGVAQTKRYDSPYSPAMFVGDANVANPATVTGIGVDASPGAERHLILTAF